VTGGPTTYSRFPTGLLELLSSKHLGTAPNELSDIVGGSVDMLPFWTSGLQKVTSAGGTVAAVGDGNTVAVPVGEYWIPQYMAMNVVTDAAGQSVRYSFSIRLPGSAFGQRIATSAFSFQTVLGAGENLLFAYELRNRYVLPPGTLIGANVDYINVAAGGPNLVSSFTLNYIGFGG